MDGGFALLEMACNSQKSDFPTRGRSGQHTRPDPIAILAIGNRPNALSFHHAASEHLSAFNGDTLKSPLDRR